MFNFHRRTVDGVFLFNSHSLSPYQHGYWSLVCGDPCVDVDLSNQILCHFTPLCVSYPLTPYRIILQSFMNTPGLNPLEPFPNSFVLKRYLTYDSPLTPIMILTYKVIWKGSSFVYWSVLCTSLLSIISVVPVKTPNPLCYCLFK